MRCGTFAVVLCTTLWAADARVAAQEEVAGKRLTDALGDPLPPGAVARLGTVRFRHGAAIGALAFMPGGKEVASVGSNDASVCFWELPTGRLRRRLAGYPDGYPFGIGIAPDGSMLAWGS